MEEETLFGKAAIDDVLARQGEEMQKAVESYDADSLLNTAAEDLAGFFAGKYRIDVPELDEQGITVESHEIRVDITHDPGRHFIDGGHHYAPATRIIYHVPFSGERPLFFVRPNTWGFHSPTATVCEQELQLVQEGEDLDFPEVKATFDQTLGEIQKNLDRLRVSVEPFNVQLQTTALGHIDSRRKRLLDIRKLAESLGFPLKRVDNHEGFSVTLQRKKIDLAPPKPSAGMYAPEPVLDQATFEEILRLTTNMALVMERSPSVFRHNAVDACERASRTGMAATMLQDKGRQQRQKKRMLHAASGTGI